MKKKLVALLLALLLMVSALPVSAGNGEDLYEYVKAVAEFIRENGLYSSDDDDPIMRALIAMLEENPEAYEVLLSYMLESYDDRTMFIPAEYFATQLQTSGYVGVGITISFLYTGSGYLEVEAVHPDGGAKRAGIEPGDHLLSIDGTPISEFEFEEVGLALRSGGAGSLVDVTVRRGEEVYDLTLERSFLGEPDYSARELEDGVWLMRWTQFRDIKLMEDFRETVYEMAMSGAKSLILDLRGNGGGLLDMAFEIVETFIPEENVHYLSVSHRDGDEMVSVDFHSPGGGLALNQIVILCDDGTASASEIIMTALIDTGHAVAVGQRTYGKATAQYEVETPSGSLMVITAYKIFSPTGNDYNLTGLYPEYNIINEEQPAAAQTGLRLREVELGFGSCSDDAERLNEALAALGMLAMPSPAYRLGDATQAAINNLRQLNGLDKIRGLDLETITLINAALDSVEESTVTLDLQMEKALELAREGAKGDLRYTMDEDGNYSIN